MSDKKETDSLPVPDDKRPVTHRRRSVSPRVHQGIEDYNLAVAASEFTHSIEQLQRWRANSMGTNGTGASDKPGGSSNKPDDERSSRQDAAAAAPLANKPKHADPDLQRLYMKAASYFDNILQNLSEVIEELERDRFDLEYARSVFEAASDQIEQFHMRHQQYMDALADNDLRVEYNEALGFTKKISMQKYKAKSLLEHFEGSTHTRRQLGRGPPESYRVSLPKRELPKFDGNVRSWLSFWASFEEIDGDNAIPESEKFQYLLQCMTKGSEAYKVVASFPACGDNYGIAAAALRRRFGDKKMLVKVYVRDLLKLVIENAKEKPTLPFTDLVTSLTSQLRNLEQLGINSTQYGEILYPVVESCIPAQTLESYMRSPESTEEIDDLLEFLNNEVQRKMCSALARAPFKDEKEVSQKPSNKSGKPATPTAANFSNTTHDGKRKCIFCSFNHPSDECRKAENLPLEQRREAVRTSDLCFRCLKPKHNQASCKAKLQCKHCGSNHHYLTCRGGKKSEAKQAPVTQTSSEDVWDDSSEQPSSSKTKPPPGKPSVDFQNYMRKPEVLLQTLLVDIHGEKGSRTVRAMFDSGSQASYILTRIARDIALPYLGEEKTTHMTFGGDCSREKIHPVYRMRVSAVSGSQTYSFDISGVDRISGKLDSVPSGSWIHECQHRGIQITGVDTDPSEIQLLIGADVYGRMMLNLRSIQLPSGPIAQETAIGWVLCGKLPIKRKVSSNGAMMSVNMCHQSKCVLDLWNLEAIGIWDAADSKSRKEIEEAALAHFKQTVSRNDEGRYVVHLPWLEAHPPLPSNKAMAVKRLEALGRKLQKDGNAEAYDEVFKSWLEEGIVEKVPGSGSGSSAVHYLPHRAVWKEGSTTPLRPVFDASAKAQGCPSLNACLEKGPNLLELIPALLTRFRLGKVGAVADIRKAFLQMEVAQQHRDSLRFLWWENPKEMKKIVEYRHRRVVFGVSSSPFLLGAAINHHLGQFSAYPETATTLVKSFYVDNCVASFQSQQEAIKFRDESRLLLDPAKFDLRGWEFGPSKEEKTVPVLGLLWNTFEDVIQVDGSRIIEKIVVPTTKRGVLSVANSIYDPLGMLSPWTLNLKLLLKSIWSDSEKCKWDDELPSPYPEQFGKWTSQLERIQQIKIPRYAGGEDSSTQNWSLHVFCDASKDAYATCVFLRVDAEPISVQLLQARTRVSPMRNVTIPRLELLSCLIGSRLGVAVAEQMDIGSLPITYWTDSTTALTWIQRQSTWATFVMNRVKEIRELTELTQWRHVPGEANPADLVSRGCSIKKLLELEWWEGPRWLYLPERQWPSSHTVIDEEAVEMERRKTVVSALTSTRWLTIVEILQRRHSDYHRLLRVMALVLRYVKLLRPEREMTPNSSSTTRAIHIHLTEYEMNAAEDSLIRMIQEESIPDAAMLTQPKCRKYDDGIVRVETKLIEDNTPFCKPAVFPGKHPLVKLMIQKEHEIASHGGVQYLQSLLREKYWILKSRKSIRSVVHSCPVCRRYLAQRCAVEEPPLPLPRTKLSKCFEVTGCDMAGPLFVDGGKKIWIALFTCAVYRAVHLEVVSELSTTAFLHAFTKFVARRGRPRQVYSDNGKNFVGAARVFSDINWEQVCRITSLQRIEWKFVVPSAPWWNGWIERLVGLLKQLLRRVIGSKKLKREEFEVLLCEAESVMNNRPLTYISDDPEDLKPLTPAMFLKDLKVAAFPETGLVTRMKKLTKLRDELQNRFRKEYLGQLVRTGKAKKVLTVSPGDVVLVEVETAKRQDWPIGLVLQVYPGIDGQIRTAKVKTKMGELLRPLQRLFPLEMGQQDAPSTTVPQQ